MKPAARQTGRAAYFVVGATLLATSLVEVRRQGIRPWEQTAFRLANRAPERWRAPVRIVMQAGTFGTVPASAAVAALAGRRRLALRLLAGGVMAWFGAKAIKPLGGRHRPKQVVEGVRIREGIAGDLGWVSGHSAVATALALTAADELPGWTLPLLAGVVATTGFGRMYVGAHLPHDVIGGIGLGMVIFALLPPGVRPNGDLR